MPVSGGGLYAQVSAGQFHACGVRTDATTWCWGVNQYGQLGNAAGQGTTTARPTPVQVG